LIGSTRAAARFGLTPTATASNNVTSVYTKCNLEG
jgi:hypothetical protein